jgi:hypothetical protein
MFMLLFIDLAIVLSMFMLLFIFVLICGLFEWKRKCADFLLFVYICIAVGDLVIKKGCWDPICMFNPATFFVPVPSQNLDFQRHMSWSFLCSVSTVKMRGDCSFCWYWWNWWPSLLKISFHISNLVRTTCFWNNLYQVRSRSKFESQIIWSFWEQVNQRA